jgi:FKBP-type peptidyl-prolyl cis-trans isomerase
MNDKKPIIIIGAVLLLVLFVYLLWPPEPPIDTPKPVTPPTGVTIGGGGSESGTNTGGGFDRPLNGGRAFANRIAGAFLLLEDNGKFTLWVSDKSQKTNDLGHYRIVKLFTGIWDTETIDQDLNEWLSERLHNDNFLELLKRDNLKFANLLVNCVVGDEVYKFDRFDVACQENSDDALAECERINQQVNSAVTWTRFPTKIGFVRKEEPNNLYFQLSMDFLGNKTALIAQNFEFRFRQISRTELQSRIDESRGIWESGEPSVDKSKSGKESSNIGEVSRGDELSKSSHGSENDSLIMTDEHVGSGVEATSLSTVEILYTATLPDGTVFDNAMNKKTPFRLAPSDDVIVGLKQGVVGMRVGGKRRITIPPTLAFGSKGMGTTVPSDATVVYSVELLKVSGS